MMQRQRLSQIAAFLSGLVTSWLILIGGYPGTASYASCPSTHPLYDGWASSGQVRYQLSGFSGPESTNVVAALDNWSTHNFGNCSFVSFGTLQSGINTLKEESQERAEYTETLISAAKARINEVGLRNFAMQIGVNHSNLIRILAGRRGLNPSIIFKLENIIKRPGC
jgi:hypothetical protein